MKGKSLQIPIAIVALFILGLVLMFNLTPTVGDPTSDGGTIPSVTDPQDTSPEGKQNAAVEVDGPLATKPSATEPSATQPVATEPLPPPDTTLPEEKAVTAHHAFAYDASEKRMLFYTGDPDSHIYPASITKLMTALVVQKHMDLDEKITVGEEVNWIDPESSRADLQVGDQISVGLLIYGLMLPSGNDAAYTIAVNCGRVIAEDPTLDRQMAYYVFVDEMNAEARLLGMQNTHFVTPDGNHDPNHYTSVNDLIILIHAALENDAIMSAVRTPIRDVTEELGRVVVWKNSNYLIRTESEYYTQSAVGMKTGSTGAAGSCLISLFSREEGYLVVGVLGSTSADNRYTDTLTLYELYS